MSAVSRAVAVLREELAAFEPRLVATRLAIGLLPEGALPRTRAGLQRLGGWGIERGVVIMGPIALTGGRGAAARVRIGARTFVNRGCVFDALGAIDIGCDVSLGHDVAILTGNHDFHDPARRGGALRPEPIRIGDGAWIAARAVVLPGVTVGEGALVCAGAVVTRSVPAHTMVGGVPAREIKRLPGA